MPPAANYPRPWIRALLSVLLLGHVLAVFLGPWALPPSSDLAGASFRLFRPYMQTLALDNGYRFFAPEPGPSHLIGYEVVQKNGNRITGSFPDRKLEWPRLLYHRHFMLSEFLNTHFMPSDAREPNFDPVAAKNSREILEACARSYARHLARQFDARQVTLFLRQHKLPTIFQVREGTQLTDPALYELNAEAKFGPYQGDEL